MGSKWFGSVLLAGAMLVSAGSHAGVILDQKYDDEVSTGDGLSAGGTIIALAQTFTVGVAGIFDSVELRLKQGVGNGVPTSDLELSLYTTTTGSGQVVEPYQSLGTASLALSQVTGAYQWYSFDFSSIGKSVSVGEVLALAYTATGYFWATNTAAQSNPYVDAYPGGRAFRGFATGDPDWIPTGGTANLGGDRNFRTFVKTEGGGSTVPEPSVLWLMLAALAGLRLSRKLA